jgi:hypothetical protein
MSDDSSERARTKRLFYGPKKAASQTRDGQRQLRAYQSALGAFVDAFAAIEDAMFYVLIWHTKTRHDVAKAIFSGTRVETAASFLRRLAEVGSMDEAEWKQLEPVIAQLHLINAVRNMVLHHGAQGIAEGRALTVDALRALTVEKIKIYPVDPETLGAMTADCHKIFVHLMTRHRGARPWRVGVHADLDQVLADAWRYKPPLQSRPNPMEHNPRRSRHPDKRQRQQPPPSASPR